MNRINYKALYLDFLNDNDIEIPSSQKASLIESINKIGEEELSFKKIRELNEGIEKNIKSKNTNTVIKIQNSYDKSLIKYILEYQEKHELSNKEVANIYKMSRNTIASWKRIFQKEHYNI